MSVLCVMEMSFTKANGDVLGKKDIAFMRGIYENLFTVYKNKIIAEKEDSKNEDFYNPIIEAFNSSQAAFMARFNEIANSEEEVDIETFYDDELKIVHGRVMAAVDKKSRRFDDFKEIFGPVMERYSGERQLKDTLEGLEISMGSFKLTNKAFKGIETLEEYDPREVALGALSEARKANSNTYDDNRGVESEAVKDANFGYNVATEYSRSKAIALRDSDYVTAADIYDAFSSINALLRVDVERGGSLRAETVEAGKIISITSASIPEQLYRLMDAIAENMNKIKETKDPLVQKSQAIQLASFAYQMSVSEHVFEDGNGRSCRMLADTILGTFGLPPHTPHISQINTGATIGTPLDFDNGARLFMRGIKISDELIKLERENRPEVMNQRAEEYMTMEGMNLKVPGDVTPKEAISLSVQSRENKVAMAEALRDLIKADHLFTKNSPEYKDVIKTAKETLKTIYNEPINSAKSLKSYKLLEKSIQNYENHCRSNPKNNATRDARLKAVFRLGTAAFYNKNIADFQTKIETKELKERIDEMKNDIFVNLADKSDTKTLLAQYFVTKYVEKHLLDPYKPMPIDTCKNILEMKPEMIEKIKNDPDLQKTISDLGQKGKLANKMPKEVFDAIADGYGNIKSFELSKKIRVMTAQEVLVKDPQPSFLC